MLKRFFSCMLSAMVMLYAAASFVTVAAEEVVEEDVIVSAEEATVEEVIVSSEEVMEEEAIASTEMTTEEVAVASEETTSQYLYNNQMTVFDAIKIKRSLMADETTYDITDYEYIRDNLIRRRVGDIEYSKKVVVQFETDGYPLFGYPDEGALDSFIANGGGKISIPQHTLQREGCSHGGWYYDGKNYIQGEEFVVPMVDKVVFTPYWFVYHKITYLAGDYDDVVEYPSFTLQGTEGVGLELADSTRFTRPGYKLVGWKCNLDDLDYGTNARYVVPDSDVVFTAIWEAAEIPLSISANNGVSTDKITDVVYAGDEFVFPECTFTNGDKTFAGWKYNKIVYQPGDVITIPALKSGLSVVITAKWV